MGLHCRFTRLIEGVGRTICENDVGFCVVETFQGLQCRVDCDKIWRTVWSLLSLVLIGGMLT
jgi:hypothetical protein